MTWISDGMHRRYAQFFEALRGDVTVGHIYVFNPAFFCKKLRCQKYIHARIAGSLYVHAIDLEPDASALFMAVFRRNFDRMGILKRCLGNIPVSGSAGI